MQYNGKFCIVCGRRIPELSLRKKTCSEFCRSRSKCGYAPYKDCTELPYDDLTSIQEEAQSAGMTYGKYMATRKAEDKEREIMPMSMECPFYKRSNGLTVYCEGAKLNFPDGTARSELVLGYCSHSTNWRKCPIAHCLENYYFRKEE